MPPTGTICKAFITDEENQDLQRTGQHFPRGEEETVGCVWGKGLQP